MKYFLVVSYEFIMKLIFSLPRFRFFNRVKSVFLRLVGAKLGARIVFYPGVWIVPGRYLEVGDDVDFALGVIVTTSGGVTIGSRTLIGYRAQIISANHKIPEGKGKVFDSGHEYKKVVIGSDCWIGANSLIMPGVTIGDGAVVAAGSVVTKDVLSYTVVAGVPAKKIRDRKL
jgi:acetyltransferase-like isoleucine patch superfamily enzyme